MKDQQPAAAGKVHLVYTKIIFCVNFVYLAENSALLNRVLREKDDDNGSSVQPGKIKFTNIILKNDLGI